MWYPMKKVLIILAGLFFLFSTPAIAQQEEGVCYDLWCANAAQLTAHIPYARVCLTPKTDCTSGNSGVTIKVTANESIFSKGPNFGIQKFGFNYTGVPSNIVATVTGADATKAANWTVAVGPSQVAGFGTFIEVAAPATNPGKNRQQPLVISICSDVKNLNVSDFVDANANNQHFAVHIAGFTTVNGVQYYDGGTPLTSAYFGNCGELTAIELSSFTAQPGNGSVTLNWVTETEVDNAGFNIYRATAENGPYLKINDSLIAGAGSSTAGAAYVFVDENLKNRKTYYYKLEDIDLNGTSTMHGPGSATPRWILGLFGK